MAVTILNPRLIDNGGGGFYNWSIGANNAWSPDSNNPDSSGAGGFYNIPGDNSLFQNSVFTDFGTGISHRVRITVGGVIAPCAVTVMFGTLTAGTISTAGVQDFTAAAAGNATFSLNILSGACNITSIYLADIAMEVVPDILTPVYNQKDFTLNSRKTSEANYEYVMDVYTGATVTGNYVSRTKMQSYPDGTYQAYYSPFSVLESYLSFDRNIHNIISGTSSVNHIKAYTVAFGDAYGTDLTGQTIYSNVANYSALTFNGVVQQNMLNDFDYTDYNLTSTTSKFLTNQPRAGVKSNNTTDRGTLTLINNLYNSAPARYFEVLVYHNSGGTTSSVFLNSAYSASSINDKIVHLPSGIWNLNNMPTALNISGATGTLIDVCDDFKYTIQALSALGNPISEALTYLVENKNLKYDTVRMQFKNSLGGFDYINFNNKLRKKTSVKKSEYQKPITHNYTAGDRGKTVFNIDANYSFTVTSDFLSYEESIWMEELLYSTEINIIDADGISTPIILDTDSIDIKPLNFNNKLFSVTFNYSPALSINTTRQ